MKTLALVCLAVVLGGCATNRAVPSNVENPGASATRPNILVILVDDLGWRDLGPYGQDFARTPRIDEFAKDSVMFTAAYSAGPNCSPTRAALMTGKYPARVNITDWIPGAQYPKAKMLAAKDLDALPLEEVTIAESLKGTGYATWHVGKWHLGREGFFPEDQGFDVNIMGSHIGHPASHFFPYGNSLDGKPAHNSAVPLRPLVGAKGEYLADRQAEEAAALLKRAAQSDTPFFLHLSFYAVHAPLEARESDIERYRELRAANDKGGQPEGEPGSRLPRPVYAAMIESLDTAVGRVLDELRASGLERSTLVVLTSDNGGLSSSTDNRPLRGGKRSLWEGGIRVPLLVRWPGVTTPGTRRSDPVITQDLYATACEVAGARPSDEVLEDSRSLVGLLHGRDASLDRTALFWHFPHNETADVGPRGAVREGRWKLIEDLEDGSVQLFDLEVDPSETRDVSKDNAGVAARLTGRLREWRSRVGANMPTPNPNAAPGDRGMLPIAEQGELAVGAVVVPDNALSNRHQCACVAEAVIEASSRRR